MAMVGALCAIGMLVAGTSTASAVPSPDIVISQLYGGGNNSGATYQNDYVELFNRGSAGVSVSGWSVQYASAAGTGNFAATALAGTIPPGGYYLVRLAGGTANGAALPTAQATGTTNMSATAGKVVVANTATSIACNGGSTACSAAQLAQIVDLVGFGTGPGGANFFEGSAAAPTTSNTLADFRRDSGCTETDDNAADFGPAATPAPRNASSAAHLCNGPTPPTGAGSANPSSVAAGGSTLLAVAVAPGTNPASTAIAVAADLTAIGGGAAQALYDDATHGDAAAGDNTFSYLATVPAATPAGSKILPAAITDAQSRTGSATIALDVAEDCGSPRTPIHDVQGSGNLSPISGSTVSIEGVVVGDYQATGEFGGFYLQEPGADAAAATSEGIFVFAPGATAVAAGDLVRARGTVVELATGTSRLTELASVSSVVVCGTGVAVAPTDITLPVPALADFERYEGMLVHFTQPLTASDTFTLARFGEVRLAAGGRLYIPTAIADPGASALAQSDLNRRRSFVLDDGDNRQNIDPTRYPLGGLSATQTLRSGDTVDDLTAVFDERFSTYRAQPVGAVSFTPGNPRTPAPPAVAGNLKVASFNVLNFFNGNGSHLEGAAGGFPTARGANTLAEFDRQIAKEVRALAAIDADIVGLMELENDEPPSSAIEDLVAALNAEAGAGTYAFIDTGVIGTDAIKVALIYKPAKVTPVGAFKVLTSAVDPRFIDTKSRPSLAQTFELNANHRRITVDVNHLKSKGSDCDDVGDPDTGDGQGNCNHTRAQAAHALVDWLASDPTSSGSPDTLVIGDMNAYTFEDPIEVFTDAGLANLVRRHGGLTAYSYVFDGESGYLDHALATPSLASKVTGAAEWHINADEPIALDYNTEFKTAAQVASFYDDGPYRSSDHDPVVVGISLQSEQHIAFTSPAPTGAVAGGPAYDVVAVAESGLPVALSIDASSSAVCGLAGSRVTFTAPGTCTIHADQPGDADHAPAARVSQSFTVAKAATKLTAAPAFTTLLGLFPVTFSATLARSHDGSPLPGRSVTFSVLASTVCSATTNATGSATCSAPIGIVAFARARSYRVAYAGSSTDLPSADTGTLTRRLTFGPVRAAGAEPAVR